SGCLRFAGVVTHPPRKTRFRLLVRLYRTGLVTRRVPSERFQASDYPPFPSFLARGQTDLEFLVEKILNRSGPNVLKYSRQVSDRAPIRRQWPLTFPWSRKVPGPSVRNQRSPSFVFSENLIAPDKSSWPKYCVTLS